MRRIQKGPEPTELQRYRLSKGPPPPTYAGFNDKKVLRHVLVQRQDALCVYCMRQIKLDAPTTVEHFLPQNGDHARPDLQLSWGNLWAVCDGARGTPRSTMHCDARKGSDLTKLDPATVQEVAFSYKRNGKMSHRDVDSDRELNEVLNLNSLRLRSMRKSAISGVLAMLRKKPAKGPWKDADLQRHLSDWQGSSRPFYPVVVYWLQKRLGIVNARK